MVRRPIACRLIVAMLTFAPSAALADEAERPSVVRYADFGAKADGKTDDLDAILKAHAYANEHNLPVRADDNATYYIGGQNKTAVIQTDTDFGTAKFIIDDTKLENRSANVFVVRSMLEPIAVEGVASLKQSQPKIDLAPGRASVVIVTDKNVKRFIRFGLNQNSGSAQTDVFLIDAQGNVDPKTPILWDFEQVTEIAVYPVDDKPLTIRGGHFTTIANQAESQYTYHARGIAVRRSNVVIDGLQHLVTGELDHGAPYGGFISIADCANVTVQNTLLTGRKKYETIGRAGKPVSMGSYDLTVKRGLNISLINCTQSNSIDDGRYWGIMSSNHSKNLSYDRCVLSRFDAHQGLFNATIRNSTLGHMGILLTGGGTCLVENSTIRSGKLIGLRPDYGSTWKGEFIIRDCVFLPNAGRRASPVLIAGANSGQHDFGYTCHMPERVVIENLQIQDAAHPDDYQGPAIFANFNPKLTDASYKQDYPYVTTRQVILKNVTTASGKPLRVSDNAFMFRETEIKHVEPE